MSSDRHLVLGWLFVALGILVMIPALIILFLNTDSLSDANQYLVAVTAGSGALIAGSVILSAGGLILSAGWRAASDTA